MWFKLVNANFGDNSLGKMDVLADAWNVTYNMSGGITKTSGSGMVSKGGTLTATFTLSTGASFTNATLTPASAGTVTHTVSSSTVTVTIKNVSANCTLSVVATGGSSTPVIPPNTEGVDLTSISMQYYNKAINNDANKARLSCVTNPYLEAGWKVTILTSYTCAGARTTDASSSDKADGSWNLTENGFKTGTFTVPTSGYYMFVMTKSDNTVEFDLTQDPATLAGYISISTN